MENKHKRVTINMYVGKQKQYKINKTIKIIPKLNKI